MWCIVGAYRPAVVSPRRCGASAYIGHGSLLTTIAVEHRYNDPATTSTPTPGASDSTDNNPWD